MRYVKIPEPIQIKNLNTGEPILVDGGSAPWRMCRYLSDIVLPDGAMGKGYDADRIRSAVRAAFKDAKPGEYVAIEDSHHVAVCAAIKDPEAKVTPVVTMQLFPFQEAFMEAERQMPPQVRDAWEKNVGLTG
tara:strand:+ start:367 stop:762 length:396 start_codon:yes stop_codon:yes gene_type:complete